MGILEEVTQLKNQGVPENEIINSLKERGFSPKDISDVLAQSKIKNAVSYEEEGINPPLPQGPSTIEENSSQSEDLYTPQPQEYSNQTSEEYYPQEDYAPIATETDTIIEISEQVFSQKTQKIEMQLQELSEFKTIMQTKVELFSQRLKRIEAIIDKLEISILEKVGSYGSNLQSIKKEMSMMQDSFGKIINKTVKKSKHKK